MILTGKLQPQRFQRVFNCPTRISIQVVGAATITIARDQGEAAGAGDGIQLTQGNTASPSQPYETYWKGELWYRSSVDGAQFVLIQLSD